MRYFEKKISRIKILFLFDYCLVQKSFVCLFDSIACSNIITLKSFNGTFTCQKPMKRIYNVTFLLIRKYFRMKNNWCVPKNWGQNQYESEFTEERCRMKSYKIFSLKISKGSTFALDGGKSIAIEGSSTNQLGGIRARRHRTGTEQIAFYILFRKMQAVLVVVHIRQIASMQLRCNTATELEKLTRKAMRPREFSEWQPLGKILKLWSFFFSIQQAILT